MNIFSKLPRPKVLLLTVLIVGFLLRTYNINWDSNFHLHPDERFLTMVGVAIQIPSSFQSYFDPQSSTMNPYNNNFPFFVYGSFPLYLTKVLAVIFGFDNYNDFTLLGRFLSALFNLGTVILVYKIAELVVSYFVKKGQKDLEYVPLIATAILSFNAFSIQQSHFFTVDTFLVFFITAAIYSALKGVRSSKGEWYFLFSFILLALATATKINALFFLPFIALSYFLYKFFTVESSDKDKKVVVYLKTLLSAILFFCFYLIVGYITYRFVQPFYFLNANFFDPRLHPQTLSNFQQLIALDSADTYFPPAVQWQSKTSIIWPIQQLFLYGLTPLVTIFSILAVGMFIFTFLKAFLPFSIMAIPQRMKEYGVGSVILSGFAVVCLVFFLYQGTRYTMNMRYFYLIYPLVSVLVSFFIYLFIKNIVARKVLVSLTLVLSIGWAFLFTNIYSLPHSRVTASRWIYSHIPAGSRLAVEHWDDALPLSFPEINGGIYKFVEIPIFDVDNPQKWETLVARFSESDYYLLTSNRGWGSIPFFQERYPQTKEFYKKLFAEEIGVKKMVEISSRPRLGPLEINDDNSEESFTVYDHPVVVVFKIVDKEKMLKELNAFKN